MICDTLGLVWTPPLPLDSVRYPGYECDHGGGSTREAGGGEKSRIQQRAVEDDQVMLAGGSQSASHRRGHPFLLERRCGVLVYERVQLQIRDPSCVFCTYLLSLVYLVHGGTNTFTVSLAPGNSELKEEGCSKTAPYEPEDYDLSTAGPSAGRATHRLHLRRLALSNRDHSICILTFSYIKTQNRVLYRPAYTPNTLYAQPPVFT